MTKLSVDGSSWVYSTYLGGGAESTPGGGDNGLGIGVDSLGSAYVTGSTNSTDFPTKNPFQSSLRSASSGGSNGFVTKLTADGSSLVYSTYLGGTGVTFNAGIIGDSGSGIAVDSSGSAYVTGTTYSSNFPTQNAFQPALMSSGGNAFVTKFSADGTALLYSTYLGGTGTNNGSGTINGDSGRGIALGVDGSAYVTGIAYSSDFPLQNALQVTNDELPGYTAFITKYTAAGALDYSTYLEAITATIQLAGSRSIGTGMHILPAGLCRRAFQIRSAFQGSLARVITHPTLSWPRSYIFRLQETRRDSRSPISSRQLAATADK